MNIEGYGICTGAAATIEDALENLKVSVLKRMSEGWEPQGGITHVSLEFADERQHIFNQAIVKRKAATP